MTSAAPNSLYAGLSPPPLVPTEPEHTETRSIILKWRLNKLGQLFESSKADGVKSKCIKSPTYDDGKWCVVSRRYCLGFAEATGQADLLCVSFERSLATGRQLMRW